MRLQIGYGCHPVACVAFVIGLSLAAAAQAQNESNASPSKVGSAAATAIARKYDAKRALLQQKEHEEDELYQINLKSCDQPNVYPRCKIGASARHQEVIKAIAKALEDLGADEKRELAVYGASQDEHDSSGADGHKSPADRGPAGQPDAGAAASAAAKALSQ